MARDTVMMLIGAATGFLLFAELFAPPPSYVMGTPATVTCTTEAK